MTTSWLLCLVIIVLLSSNNLYQVKHCSLFMSIVSIEYLTRAWRVGGEHTQIWPTNLFSNEQKKRVHRQNLMPTCGLGRQLLAPCVAPQLCFIPPHASQSNQESIVWIIFLNSAVDSDTDITTTSSSTAQTQTQTLHDLEGSYHHIDESIIESLFHSKTNMSTSSSSFSSTNEPKEIQTKEIPVPLWSVILGVFMSIGTLTMVDRADHFGPYNHPFKRTFYIFYMTYWLVLVVCCCADAELVKKKKDKSVHGRRPRRSGWV